jgi:tRNA nucleotidyltransferase/poly(A) polymerase
MDFIALDSDKNIKKFYTKLVEKNVSLKDFIYLRYADSKANAKKKTDFKTMKIMYKKILKVINQKPPFSIKDLDVSGSDIMETLNIQPGKLIGEVLRNVFDKVQEDLLENKKDAILNYVIENYRN